MPSVLRTVRAAMAIAIVAAIVTQFVKGSDNPTFRAINFISYFTILSNVGAVIVLGALALRPALVGHEPFVILRGAVTLYMAITGDRLQRPAGAGRRGCQHPAGMGQQRRTRHRAGHRGHRLVPRPLPDPPDDGPGGDVAGLPRRVARLHDDRGPLADWYPYPFLNPDLKSVGEIVVTCIGIMVAFVVVGLLLRLGARDGQSDSTPSTMCTTRSQ